MTEINNSAGDQSTNESMLHQIPIIGILKDMMKYKFNSLTEHKANVLHYFWNKKKTQVREHYNHGGLNHNSLSQI